MDSQRAECGGCRQQRQRPEFQRTIGLWKWGVHKRRTLPFHRHSHRHGQQRLGRRLRELPSDPPLQFGPGAVRLCRLSSPLLAFPGADAIDGSHNVWVANQSGTTVTKVAPDGSQFTSYACCNQPSGLAIDRLGNVWVANYYGNSISVISSSGVVVSNGSYTSGGIDHPQAIAIDGAGNVWIANYRGPSITELAGATATTPGAALSPSGGLGADAALLEAHAIAVDASGNLWISNFGSDILTQFIGLASPVRTPLLTLPVAP